MLNIKWYCNDLNNLTTENHALPIFFLRQQNSFWLISPLKKILPVPLGNNYVYQGLKTKSERPDTRLMLDNDVYLINVDVQLCMLVFI
jgi:hypothetical protein